jgi:hypothetical protein
MTLLIITLLVIKLGGATSGPEDGPVLQSIRLHESGPAFRTMRRCRRGS